MTCVAPITKVTILIAIKHFKRYNDMKQLIKLFAIVITSAVLVACGSDTSDEGNEPTAEATVEVLQDDTTDTSTTDNDSNSDENEVEDTSEAEDADFLVEITGSVTSTITDTSGEVFCSESSFYSDPENATPIIQLTGGSVYGEYVRLYIPYGTQAGTYPLIGESGKSVDEGVYRPFPEVDTALIFYGSGDSADWAYGEGTLTLVSLPTSGGEMAEGNFTIELVTTDSEYEDGNQVMLTGEFAYEAERSSFANDVDVYTETRCE
jgi:hypothetical protein